MRAKPVYDSLICFGDSLTQRASGPGGFVASLQDTYQRRLDIVSRGFAGYTSRQALALCPHLFETSKPDVKGQAPSARLTTLWFGTNDCIRPGFAQHVPVDEFRANMTTILRQYFPNTHVLLLTPTTVVSGRFPGHEDDTLHKEYGDALRRVADEVNEERDREGQKQRIILVDMLALFLDAAAKSSDPNALQGLFDNDGLHIAAPGYKVVFDGLIACIRASLPDLAPEKMPSVVADWKTIQLGAGQDEQSKQVQPIRHPPWLA